FAGVQVVGGGEFFRRNALLYLDAAELEDLTDRLAAVQPFLAEIARDPSATGVSDLLRRAVLASHDGTDVGLDLAAALDRVSTAALAAAAGRASPDPWGDALIGGSLSEPERNRVLTIRANSDFDDLLFAAPAIHAIRDAARELALDADHGLRVRITGTTVLNHEELEVVEVQGQLAALAALGLFTLAVSFGLRSLRLLFALIASLIASLVWTNAFAAAAIGHLNQVSVAFNVLIVGLGGELGIHFCLRYQELAAQKRSRAESLALAGSSIGSSLLSSAVTTAIGFLVFLPTDYRGVAELGLLSGAGVLLSLLSTLSLLPALISLGAPAAPEASAARPSRAAGWLRLPVAHARAVRWAAFAVALGSLALLPRARFDHNPVSLRDPNTESVQAFLDMLERSETSPWTIDVIAPDLASAQGTAARLAALPSVERAITLADFVPEQQEEKRRLLETMALFVPGRSPPAPRGGPAEQIAALEELAAALAPAPEAAALAASEARLREALAGLLAAVRAAPDPVPLLAQLDRNLVASLPEQIEDLRSALRPDAVTLATLPPEIRDPMLSETGRARIQVFPKRDLSDSENLEEFIDGVRAIAPESTGPAVGLVEWGRVTSGAMQQAMAVGFVATLVFLFLLWRNLWDTLLAFFPLLLAGLVTCAVMALAGWSFNFANVIVLPMLLGMGIDNGVHLVHRHRTHPEEGDVLATSTARAVWLSAITTILTFGSLAFASHRGMASLGQMLTLGVAATLVCYVVVLPAVLAWDDRRSRASAGTFPAA
ncbi:MAG TPA: MMPL family transporter, partial [Myxococcota bacterium]